MEPDVHNHPDPRFNFGTFINLNCRIDSPLQRNALFRRVMNFYSLHLKENPDDPMKTFCCDFYNRCKQEALALRKQLQETENA